MAEIEKQKEVFTVADFLQMPRFAGFEVLAGKNGCGRIISCVNVIDGPDNDAFFKGGELLLSNTYIMRNEPLMLKDIIERLAKVPAAALIVKLDRFIRVLPQEVLATADRLNFPILVMPPNFAFVDIIKPVFEEIINRQVIQLQFSEQIHQSFTELVLRGATAQEILDTLARMIQKDIIFYNQYFAHFYQTGSGPVYQEDDLTTLLQEQKYYILKMDHRIYGYLIILQGHTLTRFEEIAIEHAMTVLKLDIQKLITRRQVESKYRDEFIQDLLLHNFTSIEQIKAKEALYEWNMKNGALVVLFEIADDKQLVDQSRIYDLFYTIRKQLLQNYPNAVYTNFTRRIVFLIEPPCPITNAFYEQLQAQCQKVCQSMEKDYHVTLMVGVGSYQSSLLYAYQSYQEAQKALAIGNKMRLQIAFYEKLGLYKLLAPVSETEAAKELLSTYIAPLQEYDKKNGGNLLPMLETLLKNDWNLKETAKELFIHYNTAKYRYNKIGELLQLDFHDNENRLQLALALKLMALFPKV